MQPADYPALQSRTEVRYISVNSEPAIIVIDDIVYEDASDILKDIQVSDMSSISLLRGADAVILGPVLPEVPLSSL